MKISVPSIPEEGQTISLQEASWADEMAKEVLTQEKPGKIQGEVRLSRLDKLVHLEGDFSVPVSTACARCLLPVEEVIQVPVKMDLSPLDNPEDEITTDLGDGEDLEFGLYQGEEMDLKGILQEQLVLSLPFRYLCSPNCRGLCHQCGSNLNEGACACEPQQNPASPWAALSALKKKNS